MRQALLRAFRISNLLTSIATVIMALAFLTRVTSFSMGGLVILAVFVISGIAGLIYALYEYHINSGLAELCHAPIEDIYFARDELGWQKEWIESNVPGFNAKLMDTKRRLGIPLFK